MTEIEQEPPPGFSLIEHAKTVVRKEASELEGPDDDIPPMFLWLGAHGYGIMPIADLMKGDEEKDKLTVVMTAALVVGRATEAIHISTAWMAQVDTSTLSPEELERMKQGYANPRPADRPDRIEAVVLTHITTDTDSLVDARVTRHKDKPPELGEWETRSYETGSLGGRFGDAIHLGLSMVKELPPELIDIIKEGWEVDRQAELMNRFIKMAAQLMRVQMEGGTPKVARIKEL